MNSKPTNITNDILFLLIGFIFGFIVRHRLVN